jgi:heat shock protein HslJ
MTRAILVVGAAAVLAACASEPKEVRYEGEWELASIDGHPVSVARTPTLLFEEKRVSGHTGVNAFGGELISSQPFDVGPFAMTKMAGPPDAMALESRYVFLLDKSDRASIEGDTLTMTAPGETPMVFRRKR